MTASGYGCQTQQYALVYVRDACMQHARAAPGPEAADYWRAEAELKILVTGATE